MTQEQERLQWQQALATHAIHDIEPVGTSYVLGCFDARRFTLRGYNRELRAGLRAMIRPTAAPKKFVIVARPRSGTTLLKRLMNQVPGVMCDAEKLSCAVIAPRRFVNNLAHRPGIEAYGVKILTYQLLEAQKITRTLPAFFEGLVQDGFTLIHLRRETFGQTLSLVTARATSAYHIPPGHSDAMQEVEIDVEMFARQCHRSKMMLEYEDLLFSRLPHISLQYEKDLKGEAAHQATIDRICDALSLASAAVHADLTPTSKRTVITNRDALQKRVASGAAHIRRTQ